MDQVTAMATFVRVVEHGSLSAAARATPASLTSVSRIIARLEARYGTQLMVRTTRRLALTDAGRLLYERAKSVLAEIRDLETSLASSHGQPSGRLRVSAPTLMGRLLVAPLLPELLRLHPALSIDLLLVDRAVDMIEEDIHIALRIGRLPDSQLVARRLGDLTMIVCTSPAYLQQRGTPQTPADLVDHDCLVFSDAPGAAAWRFRAPDGAEHSIGVAGRLRINSLDVLVAAAKAGTGIVRVPSWQVKDDIAAGQLQRLLVSYELPATAVHLLFPAQRLGSPRTRAFVDHLAAHWTGSHPRPLLVT